MNCAGCGKSMKGVTFIDKKKMFHVVFKLDKTVQTKAIR